MQGRLIINYPNSPNKPSTFIPNCELIYHSYNGLVTVIHDPLEGNGEQVQFALLVITVIIGKDSIHIQGFVQIDNMKYDRCHLDFFPTPEPLAPKLKQGKH
jgi:hypothetical protein